MRLKIEGGLPATDRRRLAKALSEEFETDMPLILELLILSEEEIHALNLRERGVDAVTDVLSFPAMELKRGEKILSSEHGECVETVEHIRGGKAVLEDRLYLGSVAVCRRRAEEQAEEYGHSVEREMCYLIVHGALHCLGYDHETEEDKREMRTREEAVMARLNLRREG